MFSSLALLLVCGLFAGLLFSRLGLPSLLGMLLAGMLLHPLLDPDFLALSADLRQIALIVILIRAGLDLDLSDLKAVGRPAILMCFVPATFEILGCLLVCPLLLGFSMPESLLAGSVLAAVSPAVIVPGMLKLMKEGRGTKRGIPQLILAGASLDDIYCLVLFACFSTLAESGTFNPALLLRIPTSILLGLAAGWVSGLLLSKLVDWLHLSSLQQIILLMAFSFGLVWIEKQMTGNIGFSGLLAVIAMSLATARQAPEKKQPLSASMNSIWQCAQIFLFVLVGAAVDLSALSAAGLACFLVILCAMAFRMAGVYLSVAGSRLTWPERLFCMLAYTPKATVQAAIGSVPLAMGLACGNTILALAVLAILITAPLGAIAIEKGSVRLL